MVNNAVKLLLLAAAVVSAFYAILTYYAPADGHSNYFDFGYQTNYQSEIHWQQQFEYC
jgi:hypothetical protein